MIVQEINLIPMCKALPGNGGDTFHPIWGNLYVTSKGYVTPCCWFGTQQHLTALWKKSGVDPKTHNIYHYSMKEIINGPMFAYIEKNMNTLKVCQEKCVEENFDVIV